MYTSFFYPCFSLHIVSFIFFILFLNFLFSSFLLWSIPPHRSFLSSLYSLSYHHTFGHLYLSFFPSSLPPSFYILHFFPLSCLLSPSFLLTPSSPLYISPLLLLSPRPSSQSLPTVPSHSTSFLTIPLYPPPPFPWSLAPSLQQVVASGALESHRERRALTRGKTSINFLSQLAGVLFPGARLSFLLLSSLELRVRVGRRVRV